MATHKVILTEKTILREGVGNSMATFYGWYPERRLLVVEWRGEYNCFREFVPGDAVQFLCGGYFPEVRKMIPPSNPVARVAWERRFFKGKRRNSLAQLKEEATGEKFYDHGRGYYAPAVNIYEAPDGSCAVAYKAAMEGQVGVPWGWWASPKCQPEVFRELVNGALGAGASFK